MSLTILHLSYSKVSDGGISSAVSNLVKAQNAYGIHSHWIATDTFPSFSLCSPISQRFLKLNPSLIHIHGLWRRPTRIAYSFASMDIPYIVTPHGMLDSWAMKNSAWKKQIAWFLWEYSVLSKASCIQALCSAEAHSIRSLLPTASVAVIPNGIDIHVSPRTEKAPPPWSGILPDDAKVLLFLGRYHPKKGLQPLISAWKSVSHIAGLAGWHIVFIGYGDNGELEKQVHVLKRSSSINNIHVLGPSFGAERSAAFISADAFILPSFSEGLPMAAIEAMSYSTPCLLSQACNLQDALSSSSALLADPEHESLTNILLQLFTTPSEALQALGVRGKEYVQSSYNWDRVCSRLNRIYSQAIGEVW